MNNNKRYVLLHFYDTYEFDSISPILLSQFIVILTKIIADTYYDLYDIFQQFAHV